MDILDCGHPESEHNRGYGIDLNGKKHCYDCCAKADRERMRTDDNIDLYLVDAKHESPMKTGSPFWTHELTNWPGSLSIQVRRIKTGHHNIAGKRYDVWFTFEGHEWHGVQYGDNTQICHCRKLKQ